jgi:Bacterial Ig domain
VTTARATRSLDPDQRRLWSDFKCSELQTSGENITHLSKAMALAFIVAAPSLATISSAQAQSECTIGGTFAAWGSSSTGDVTVPSSGCLLSFKIEGVMARSKIVVRPQHGTLTQRNVSTYVYKPKAGYRGPDTFAVEATGKGPKSFGTSVVTMNATVQ